MARQARGRGIDGIVVVDKPGGMSSNQLRQQVKRLYNAEKAGHTGSLDPLATGVLPVCLGEATKVSQYLLDADKGYIAHVRLGATTTTGDAQGEPTGYQPVPELDHAALEVVLSAFVGDIAQEPPVYSALKQDGVPLYKLARAGKEIRSKLRTITIHSIRLLEWQSPQLVIEVYCSKGTYIRTLAEDIGHRIGCGAHITALRRCKAGPFTLAAAHTLENLQALPPAALDAVLVPADEAIAQLPAFEIGIEQRRRLRQGQAVQVEGGPQQELLRVYCGGEFIGIAVILPEGVLQAVRLMQYTQA
ncbi:MAG: tRNA pseudouridine(55) synthase TruB [Pseudohongiellaceae bacterium]